MQILKTKLFVPPARLDRVFRVQLIERLHTSSQYPLTLISAPAGFGKTTLVSCWLTYLRHRQQTEPNKLPTPVLPNIAWLSLDVEDNDPLQFGAYTIAALQDGAPNTPIANQIQPASEKLSLEQLFPQIINAFSTADSPTLFILDDYHLIENEEIHEALSFFLAHLPPQLHLMLLSRTEPPLPLARLRAKNQLLTLDTSDLRFSPSETELFLNKIMGLGLDVGAITELDGRTEGWVTGLQLAALSLQGRHDAQHFIDQFSGDDRFVADYLIEEVLRNQTREMQEFLLKTAVLQRFNASLCNLLTGQNNSQAMLDQLESDNLFLVPLDNTRTWYRYHHLFTELLQNHLQREMPEQEVYLHQQAANWFELADFVPETVHHALAADNIGQAIQIIKNRADATWIRGGLNTVLHWINMLPESVWQQDAELSLYHAWVMCLYGDYVAMRASVQFADDILQNENRLDKQRILGIRHAVLSARESYSAESISITIQHVNKALEYLSPGDFVWRIAASVSLGFALLSNNDIRQGEAALVETLESSYATGHYVAALATSSFLVDAQIAQGKLNAALKTCKQALEVGHEQGLHPQRTGDLYTRLLLILYYRNELESVHEQLPTVLDWARESNNFIFLQEGYLVKAYLCLAEERWQAAHDNLLEVFKLADTYQLFFIRYRLDACQAQLWLQTGQMDRLQKWAESIDIDQSDDIRCARAEEYLVLTDMMIAQSEYHRAEKLIAQLLMAAEQSDRGDFHFKALLRRAVIRYLRGQIDDALADLKEAVYFAEVQGYKRPFLDLGQPMQTLLKQLARQEMTSLTTVKSLLAAFDEDLAPTPELEDPLTKRELETLRLIAVGLSNQDIAESLIISIYTVKNHNKRIFQKLQASNRTDAVIRARELGLL